MKALGESKSFCTCPPSGNQVDGLPLAPRNKDSASASRLFFWSSVHVETRRVFLSSDEVCDANVLVNLYFSDSHYI